MRAITLFEGDGIGPELTQSVLSIFDVLKLPLEFERYDAGLTSFEKTGQLLPAEALASVRRNKVFLKAPITTPVASGFRSINVALRKEFDLYANIRPARSLPQLETRYKDIDIVIFRENTEDLYIGEEEMISADEAVAIKRITRAASHRIIRLAFDYVLRSGRKKLTCVHKANILKYTDGLFLEEFRRISADYPDVKAEDLIVDNASMQLVMNPENFDVMVMPNLYGDILSDITAGLIGGLGLLPSVNRNEEYAMFEAVHGSAPDIAGKNKANPTAFLLSACMMLEHLDFADEGARLRRAIARTYDNIEDCTADVGGKAGTREFTQAVIRNLN
ncbi:MAG: isocitrate/isopropylmalate dehydrogenase family protein [Clostridiaceae bacterium]|jgi:isocitrate dehydrogenase (NAD+)|nr:isocitrate/isopropylmalate dehydrogenase family protein [Clostridiaceae bacterium]